MKRLLLITAAALAVAAVPHADALTASRPQMEQMSSSVPAFDAFHEVIMPMWHTAYPAKDASALRKMAKDVEAGAATIVSAKLPAILREKEAAWAKALAEFKTAAEGYVKTASLTDDAGMLKAAEALHTTYEALGRTIRPVVPELDAFHKVLYVVQHTFLPEKDYKGIGGVSADLVAKAEALSKAKLPTRVAAKSDAFQKSATALVADAKALDAACKAGKSAEIEKAADALHSRYQAIEKLFE